MCDVTKLPQYGYGELPGVYTAMEFERLYAANGPTEGAVILRDGKIPKSAAVIHGVGGAETGCPSDVNSMYAVKFTRYLKHKIPDIEIKHFYRELCTPGKSAQRFYEEALGDGVEFVRCDDAEVSAEGDRMQVKPVNGAAESASFAADMVILAPAMTPEEGADKLAETLGIERDERGFFKTGIDGFSSVVTSREGIFVAGCAESPKDIGRSSVQAAAAVGKALSNTGKE